MNDPFQQPEKNIVRTAGDIAKMIPTVFRYLWHVSPIYLVLTCALMAVTAFIPAAIVYTTKLIVDGVVEIAGQSIDWSIIVVPLVCLFALWVGRVIFNAISGFAQGLLSEMVFFDAQKLINEKAAQLDLAFFESPHFYDQLHHAKQNYYRLGGICWSTLMLVQQSFSLVAMVSLLSVLHPLAIILLFVTVLPRMFTEGYIARKQFDLQSELVRNHRMLEYLSRLLTSRESSKEIRAFSLKNYFSTKFNGITNLNLTAMKAVLLLSLKVNSGFEVLSLSGLICIWIFAVMQAVQGEISLGDLVMVFQAAQQSQGMLSGLIRSGGSIYQNSLFVTRFFEFLELDPKSVQGALKQHPDTFEFTQVPVPLKTGFEFDSVSFKYPGSDEWVIRDLSFTMEVGKRVALAGENGAGKTTIVKLLNRLYDPTEGRILLDGVDLCDYPLDELRQQISVVFQDYFRYDLSAADNIGVGDVQNIDKRSMIEAAAKRGGVHDVIERLPNHYETILGKTFDEGLDLSGGEWQHLAIARAFMSRGQVMVLDEPTAALDAFREQKLYEEVNSISRDKSILFISHRFSTVRMADEIIVIQNGRLIEHGDHDSLIAANGHYAAMFTTQAEKYR